MLNHQEDAPLSCKPVVKHSSVIASSISSISYASSSSSNSISITNASTARENLLMEIFDKKSPITEKSTVE
ncbi:unnamed protein product [Rotaria sp. Silwood2]|nr:unnamed protein product [Rotaria sp. Silwood2]CAF4275776.1 unnamed protein product [Rotaria sp. Silwood2]